ncbi:MAG: 50S ribosomal protein L19e [Nanoarchaeota archaeon]|nr:50S ribosomal protein L19e [Nanoarchaeota archaeon]MBU1445027.1 50S ribosomal protein L19e [Nanoarchaeota archaeon]MBU2420037.1 50S ribosomal protein L19e [Nanoarchaeota archaeon]MBU2475483.1 50S ribosomal protein L19e [Nanoarchaeota archaeon]MBU3940552.1 50S ribosomal protein L19e [Nanoarchaeota archaeon]
MKVNNQKRIAADVLKCGVNRVWFDESRLDEIKEAITKADIRRLIGDKAIKAKPLQSTSRAHARKILEQKRKGRRKGSGKRKGKRTARLSDKVVWMIKVRLQRNFIKELRDKKLIAPGNYRILYRKVKGGFFRSKRHIKLYITENKLVQNVKK